MDKHEFVNGFKNTFADKLPDHIREEIQKYRETKLTNTSIHGRHIQIVHS